MSAGPVATDTTPHRRWWRRWLVDPILGQLRQGITPDRIALTIAVAFALGIFPIMGTTTALCALAGILLKLNQPILQLANYVFYPLQLALIFPFLRFGEWIYRATPLSFSFSEMLDRFRASPLKFFSDFGWTFLHAITAWALLAPLAACLLYFILRPILRAAAQRLTPTASAANV